MNQNPLAEALDKHNDDAKYRAAAKDMIVP